jgi:hypothetical protein
LQQELDRLHTRQVTEVERGRQVYGRITQAAQDLVPSRESSRLAGLGAVGVAALAGLVGATRLVPPSIKRLGRPGRRLPQAGQQHTAPAPLPVVTETPSRQLTDVARNLLLGFVLPLWLAAGLSDWLCHRRARIERNAGRAESAIHLLMLGEAAVPVVAGLFLEITSPVLLLMFAAVIVHGATALWDVSFAVKRREVTPIEQHVHSYLEMVPLMAASFVAVLHWPEVRALFGFGRRPADWTIRHKRRPLPRGAVTALLAATVALELAPYLEEFWRAGKWRPQRHASRVLGTGTS